MYKKCFKAFVNYQIKLVKETNCVPIDRCFTIFFAHSLPNHLWNSYCTPSAI